MSDHSNSARRRRGKEKVHSSFSESPPVVGDYSHGIAIQCQYCPGQAFRRSKLRAHDFQDLLLMRYPVRCLRCGQRQKVSFTLASVSVPSHVKPRRHRRSAEKFADWPPSAGGAKAPGARGVQNTEDAPRGEL